MTGMTEVTVTTGVIGTITMTGTIPKLEGILMKEDERFNRTSQRAAMQAHRAGESDAAMPVVTATDAAMQIAATAVPMAIAAEPTVTGAERTTGAETAIMRPTL